MTVGGTTHNALVQAFRLAIDAVLDAKLAPGDMRDKAGLVEAMLDPVLAEHPEDARYNGLKAEMIIDRANHRKDETQFAEALPYLRKALTRDPENINLVSGMAHALYETGQYAQARPYLDRLIEKYPSDSYVGIMLSFTAYKTGDYECAMELMETLILPDLENVIHGHTDEIREMMAAGLAELRDIPKPLAG